MPSAARALARYDQKRDFGVTSEPRGDRSRRKKEHALAFVVQKHDATRLHYDFRLEHDGVLWSWAVPKGPSLDPGERRLAARTEDHPLEYAKFEGTIPEGEYGGGPVIVWDRGTWIPDGDPAAAMKKGHLRFSLRGEKLSGTFHLVRLRPKQGQKESWLLFKSKDEAARAGSDVVAELPTSVVSGRTIDDVRAGKKAAPKAKATRGASATTKASAKTNASAKTKAEPASAAASGLSETLDAMSLGFSITSPEKILFPDSGITKGDVMGYLAWIAPRMVPFVRDRPLMILRCPEGRGGQCFYQKHAGTGVPKPIRKVRIPEKTNRGETLVIDDLAGLVALGQIGALEIHTWMCRAVQPERPDQLVLDLDPDPSVGFDFVIETALALRKLLASIDVRSFVKTTGGKGLHVVAPIAPAKDWDTHERNARTIVEHLAAQEPARYVTTMSKAARQGKIFLDWLRNGRGATAVAPYSLRARDGAPVAMPVTWTQLERGVDPRSFGLRSFVESGPPKIDPWKGYFDEAPLLDASRLAPAGSRPATKTAWPSPSKPESPPARRRTTPRRRPA